MARRTTVAKPAPLDPSVKSGDYNAMLPFWEQVDAILGGVTTMREAGIKYLPRFVEEKDDIYRIRRDSAVLTNIYRDVVENLASKPFAEEAHVDEDAAEDIKKLCEDIDGRGNSLHVFLGETFFCGINYAVDWILVDKQQLPSTARTVADEKAVGARPYWVHVKARNVLAVYTAMVEGKEQVVHARIYEPTTEKDPAGFGEVEVKRVRVFNRLKLAEGVYGPPAWELWEEKITRSAGKTETTWVQSRNADGSVMAGILPIPVIPMVPFVTGRRKGTSWQFYPPMMDAADAQIDHYQQENGLKEARVMTAFPMLSADGVKGTDNEGQPLRVPVGPRSVLFGGMSADGKAGSWKWIEIGAQSLNFLRADLDRKEQQIRELGRNPLTAQTGNLTVITTAVAAAKGGSAVKAWALLLKDAAELAMMYTTMWLGRPTEEPEVAVHTDFSPETETEKGLDSLEKARERKDISQEDYLEELRRRNILRPEFDIKENATRLEDEAPDEPTAEDIANALPKPAQRPAPRLAA